MLRHLLLLIICSILVIFFIREFTLILYALVYLHNLFIHLLGGIFAGDRLGSLIRQAISLMLVPIIITAIPGFIYWLLTHRELGYFYFLTWAVWIMLATCIAWHK